MNFLKNIIDADERHLSKINKLAKQIDALKDEMRSASDSELRQIVNNIRGNIILNNKTTDEDLVKVFGVVREVDYRLLNQFPYFVQLIGGLVLYYGDIAEMKTGEGKTLTSTLPIVMRALENKSVHVVTTNAYLAMRDYELLRDVYAFLGLSVSLNQVNAPHAIKQMIFSSSIVYTTNSELGFDYLRDGFISDKKQRVINAMNYALIDEVDSILIDEARTPLIIAAQGSDDQAYYQKAQAFIDKIKQADIIIDEESRSAYLSDSGMLKLETFYDKKNMYAPDNMTYVHAVNQALKANFIFKRDIDYVSKDNEILIVDKYTGRILEGREYSDGLHQAIQAKEKVLIKSENKTKATITYQNFFRLYDILAGMSGTAKSEEEELFTTYNMRSFCVPTNKPVKRNEMKDKVFKNKNAKIATIVADTIEHLDKGQPVLIGTGNIEDSILLSKEFSKKHIIHEVLNGTQDKNEAVIVAHSGYLCALTIATNIAGRGTDIPLQEGVNELGGLCVFGFERFDSLRIDNQLKGRCARQGDNGIARMYVSIDDALFIEHANEQQKIKLLKKKDDELIRLINLIQIQAQANHYNARKQMLKYEDEMRLQREVIMEIRERVLNNQTQDMVDVAIKTYLKKLLDDNNLKLDNDAMIKDALCLINKEVAPHIIAENIYDAKDEAEAYKLLIKSINSFLNHKYPFATFDEIKRDMLLSYLDNYWCEHIDLMMHLKSGIHLRSNGGQDPAMVFKQEGYQLFNTMMEELHQQIGENLIAYLKDEGSEGSLSLFQILLQLA